VVQEAAEQGHPRAQFNLGINYYYGQGVSLDTAEGLHWLRKAAAAGNQMAMNELKKLGERW
jgi:uncharacterized protein